MGPFTDLINLKEVFTYNKLLTYRSDIKPESLESWLP